MIAVTVSCHCYDDHSNDASDGFHILKPKRSAVKTLPVQRFEILNHLVGVFLHLGSLSRVQTSIVAQVQKDDRKLNDVE